MPINDSNIEQAQKLLSGVKNDFTTFRKSSVVKNTTDFLSVFQDPTYLCFKIFFHGIGTAVSPTTTGDIVKNDVMNFAEKKGWYAPNAPEPTVVATDETVVPSDVGLFGGETKPNSALFYLKSIGDTARFNMLKDFIQLLSKINTLYPWYFQSIEGLGEAWKRDYMKPKFKKELTLQCLESVDLRMTLLMDLYRKIVWDWKHRRRILPANLSHFHMTIKVYDFRNFTIFPKDLNNLRDGGIPVPPEADNFATRAAKLNKAFLGAEKETERTQISFDFSYCEFEPDDSGTMLGTISNATPTEVNQTIKISYENIEENNIFKSLASLSNDSRHYYVKDYLQKELHYLNQEPLIKSPDSIKDVLVGLGQGLAANVSSRASDIVTSKLNNLFLGNVYGFSANNIVRDPLGTVTSTASNIVENIDTSKASKKLDNVFADFNPNIGTTSNQKGNIYDNDGDGAADVPDTSDASNLGNVYE